MIHILNVKDSSKLNTWVSLLKSNNTNFRVDNNKLLLYSDIFASILGFEASNMGLRQQDYFKFQNFQHEYITKYEYTLLVF